MSGDNQDTENTLAAIRQLVESQNQSGDDDALRLDTIVWRGATGREDHIPHVADLAKSGAPTPPKTSPSPQPSAYQAAQQKARPVLNTSHQTTPGTAQLNRPTPSSAQASKTVSGQSDLGQSDLGLTAGSFGANPFKSPLGNSPLGNSSLGQVGSAQSDIGQHAPADDSPASNLHTPAQYTPAQPTQPAPTQATSQPVAPSYNRTPDLHQMPPVADNSPLPRLPKLGAAKEAELARQRQEEEAARAQNQPPASVPHASVPPVSMPHDSDITPPQTAAMMESRISDMTSDIRGDASKPTRESSYQAERAPHRAENGLDGGHLSAFPDLRLVGMEDDEGEEDSTSGLFTRSVRSAMQDIIRSQINGWLRENMTEIIEDALREELRPSKPVARSKTRLNRKFDKRSDT